MQHLPSGRCFVDMPQCQLFLVSPSEYKELALFICEIKQKSIYLHTILHLTPYNLTSYFFTTF